jgi:serine/threonine protein kinase/Flp pilus assembly protein TadD
MSATNPGTELVRRDLERGDDAPLDFAYRLAEEMTRRWRAGDRPLAEELLADHPSLLERPEIALELVAEELYLRQEHGEPLKPEVLESRFPQWRRQVRALLDCHSALAPRLATPRMPAVGEELGDFHLLAELGKGTSGTVFLAKQPALSDRPVVLKVGSGIGEEHLSLARLQHTSIVPLYSVHDFPERGLRALCLPYFGGATLAELLIAVRDVAPANRSGRDLLAAIRRAGASAPVPVATEGPACDFLARSSYVRALCRIGVCLADALAYATERGLHHLDLKPSNVLIAADGQPMLLDFHLARGPLAAGTPAPAWLGGTPEYMPPEQKAALEAVRESRPIATAIDGRADIYALGVLLYEALGGPLPLPERHAAHALRRRNSQVSVGLAAILTRCLDVDPTRRYPTPGAVARDVQRHLDDLPLNGVANRSFTERLGKWRRRRPLALPAFALLMIAITGGTISLDRAFKQVERARSALRSGDVYLHRRQYSEAAEVFRHGQTLLEGIPFSNDIAAGLREGTRSAERGLAAFQLHQTCEQLRPLYGADLLQRAEAKAALAHCRTFWDQRQRIVEHLAVQPDGDLEREVRADLLDLAILRADLLVRLAAPAEAKEVNAEALEVLDQAEMLFGTSCVLNEERRSRGLSEPGQPRASVSQRSVPGPRDAWEHFALGRAYFRAGDIELAEKQMTRALELEPGSLWPNFWKGNCAFRAKRFDDAIVAFSVCIALAPSSGWCYSNRGLANAEMGRFDRAADDFEHALRLEPTLGSALRGRGLLHYRAGRYPEAMADLRRMLELGTDPGAVYGDLALVHFAMGDRAAALACARQALKSNADQQHVRALIQRLTDAR